MKRHTSLLWTPSCEVVTIFQDSTLSHPVMLFNTDVKQTQFWDVLKLHMGPEVMLTKSKAYVCCWLPGGVDQKHEQQFVLEHFTQWVFLCFLVESTGLLLPLETVGPGSPAVAAEHCSKNAQSSSHVHNFRLRVEGKRRTLSEKVTHQHGQIVHMSLDVVPVLCCNFFEVLQFRLAKFIDRPHKRGHPTHTARYTVPCQT